MSGKSCLIFSLAFATLLTLSAKSEAQVSRRAATLITSAVDENDRVVLSGNTHPALGSASDLGEIAGNTFFPRLLLQLKRSPESQNELERYLEELHNPNSPNYRRWGTAAEFNHRFGLAQSDLDAVTTWLRSYRFRVNAVHANLAIDFSGTAAQVRAAFHTSIHDVEMNGAHHIANVRDPEIPAALAGVIAGPVAFNNFKPRPLTRPHPQYTLPGTPLQFVVPLDLHTIYNSNPVYAAGISGQGQTVVVLEPTNLYSDGDWYAFRKTMGLSRRFPLGNLKTIHPDSAAGFACDDPGVLIGPEDVEAAVDVEWASAAAPNASIVLASCADTETSFGAHTALLNLLTGSAPPPAIMSLSYGAAESEAGAGMNAFFNSLYQLAVFEGVTLFVSSGDAAADIADQNKSAATHGINVNALASTAYNVAVGGTDFADAYFGENSTYWNSSNGPSYNSARSYIPEVPWNDSCAGQLAATHKGFALTYGADSFCNSAAGMWLLTTDGGGGGLSACASGTPSIPGTVSGTCKGYTKPAFQRGFPGNPSDGVRDIPDVSVFASNGFWGHLYVVCSTDPASGEPCSTPPYTWTLLGGTSFGAPIMAGFQSLINQAAGARQGNANFTYYRLANAEYSSGGERACSSSLGSAVDPGCIFYDVTLGDTAVNCLPLKASNGQVLGKFSCYYPATNPGVNGVLSTSVSSYKPAYAATPGWDFATGIGTINVFNLVSHWPGAHLRPAVSHR